MLCLILQSKSITSSKVIMKISSYLKIHNKELEVIQKTKYLGVEIDNSVNSKEHIKRVLAKVSRAIGFLRHAKTFLPQETLKPLYKGIVEPHFRYFRSAWSCVGSSELNRLQKLRNRASRSLSRIPQADN